MGMEKGYEEYIQARRTRSRPGALAALAPWQALPALALNPGGCRQKRFACPHRSARLAGLPERGVRIVCPFNPDFVKKKGKNA